MAVLNGQYGYPFLHQLTMESSLFEPGPVISIVWSLKCGSVSRYYGLVSATGTVSIWDFCVAWTKGGGSLHCRVGRWIQGSS